MGTGAELIVASAILSAGTSMYASNEQKKAQEKAQARLLESERAAEEERKRIAEATKPEEESASGIEFGSGDGEISSTADFLIDKPDVSKLGTTGGSGLGFAV